MDSRLLDVVRWARSGQRDAALAHLRAYIQANPKDAEAWAVLGALAPDERVARSAFRRALVLDPQHAIARRSLDMLESRQRPSAPPPEPPAPVTDAALPLDPGSAIPTPDAAPPDVDALISDAFISTTDAGEAISDADVVSAEGETLPPDVRAAHLARDVSVPFPDTAVEPTFQAMRDARALIWPFLPARDKRALGELLDERRVTRQDLIWAAAEARAEDVREASRVVLDTVHRLPDVAMSLEDARLIAWPFRRLNRPLGDLVDTGTVRVKDLRRAAWFAKDARLREAARMLLPTAVEKREAYQRDRGKHKTAQKPVDTPSPLLDDAQGVAVSAASQARRAPQPGVGSSRPMPVIQGANYLAAEVQRRNRWKIVIAIVMGGLVLTGICGLLTFAGVGLVRQTWPPLWIVPLVAALFLPLLWLSERYAELHQEWRSFRQGQLGESHVAQQLRNGLGGDWTLFRNVQLPGNHGDIDMVLLGPPGVFALEVKAYAGTYRYRKQHFYRRTFLGWRRLQHNPGKQTRASGGLLHAYISTTLNRNVWVEPRLVWVGPGALSLQNPEVFVWYFDRLELETKRLRGQPPRLSAEERAALSGLLRGLCSTLR